MKKQTSAVKRREFFKASAAAFAGYSLIVRAPALQAGTELEAGGAPAVPKSREHGGPGADPHMTVVELSCDFAVAGGGLAGICAALAAARRGHKVVLVQDRSRLGGNASSEVKMHPLGMHEAAKVRESGLIEELVLENAWNNEDAQWELWDLMLYDKVISEPNITLLLDTTLHRAVVKGNKLESVWCRCDRTEHLYHVTAPLFLDATGDARLSLEAGAEFTVGREPSSKYGEALADFDPPGTTQGSSILFTSRDFGHPVAYTAPSWARSITSEDLKFRKVGPESWHYGYWWIELGGDRDTIRDNEKLRHELLAVVLGIWDHIKNSGNYPQAENWGLTSVGMLPGKRDSRRVYGDHILVQQELEGGWKQFTDGVAGGGWSMDDHPAPGFNARDRKPCQQIRLPEAYAIPLGCLYSRNVPNLLLAGRNISASHVAFSTTRVMKTTACIGQAAGTAAVLCVKDGIVPRDLRKDPVQMKRLQQELLRDDQFIPGVRNEDPADLARAAKVRASGHLPGAEPANLLTGITVDKKGTWANRWAAPMEGSAKPWIELSWDKPRKVREVQIIFDTGMERDLTMSVQNAKLAKMKMGGQPECVREYRITAVLAGGGEKELVHQHGNYQRLRRHTFEPLVVKALRLECLATHGVPEARVYEIRAYA